MRSLRLKCVVGLIGVSLAGTGMGFCQNAAADWNAIGFTTIVQVGGKPSGSAGIFFAYEDVAMFDAANSIERHYQPFAVRVEAPRGASVDSAVVAAAHDVLLHYFPAQESALDAFEANSFSQIADSQAKTDGITVGQSVAAQWIALRANDGLEAPIQYVWGHGPGIWEPVPPFPPPAVPWLPYFKPFTYASGSDFLWAITPPPALTSKQWAADYNLTKAYGALNGSLRTPQQTEIGQFWADHPYATFTSGLQRLIAEQKLSTAQTARLLAMTYVSVSDTLVACVAAKYHYAFWRPYTAIHNADTDGNPATVPDPNWLPLDTTPGHPEYPAAHGCATQALAVSIGTFFGTPKVHFQVSSNITGTTHDFSNLIDLVSEVDSARIFGGMHYLHSVLQGNIMGTTVTRYVLSKHFRRVDE